MTQRISAVTRMPSGVTNASPRQTMANYGCPDPMWSAYVDLDYIQNGDITALTQNGGATLVLVAGVVVLATVTTGSLRQHARRGLYESGSLPDSANH